MLIPIPMHLKDGGSIEYKAILYTYTKIHRLNNNSPTGYEDGWGLKILGIDIASHNLDIIYEHVIDIKSNSQTIKAITGSFCYEQGSCIDKIAFEDFNYDVISSHHNDKLYIDNLDGIIKTIELFDYNLKEDVDIDIEYTNEYIIIPNIKGLYIFKINATYEGKSISYYFMSDIQ
jgi:hypothetical protein